MTDKFDVIVIGAGPAGYVAAIRCAQRGLKTACVDNWLNEKGKASLGGTCLNVGCIPSKALLESSELYYKCQQGLDEHGIKISGLELDLHAMMARKNKVVKELTQGISGLFKANKITSITGRGRLLINKQVEITAEDESSKIIQAENIIIATGSSCIEIPGAKLDNELVVGSSAALEFDHVPERVGVIGAGVIGLELGSVWRRLGANVMLIEAQDHFLPILDEQIAKIYQRDLKKQGLEIKLNSRLLSSSIIDGKNKQQVEIIYQDQTGEHKDVFDKLIVAVGRSPNSENIFDEEVDMMLDERGFIHVNDQCETSLPGVYAIGDVVRGPMLAHKGSEEGIMVAELIAGRHAEVNYDVIPSVIYTHPEVAWVGKNEQHIKTSGEPYNIGVFPFAASGRARAQGETSGMVKIISHADTDRVLGVHIMGPQASELIAQAVLVMEMGASAEDIALTIYAHPTLSESLHEAAMATASSAIHIAQKAARK